MTTYSLAQAKDKLSALVDEAMSGEPVVITRHGRKVVELRAYQDPQGRPMTQADFDWIDSMTGHLPMPEEDAGTFTRRMRDEDRF